MIVSPDGSVWTTHDPELTIAGIELKCPVFVIHKEVPQRYVSEIEALNVESLNISVLEKGYLQCI